MKILKRKKPWKPFRSCLLNSTAYRAQFWWKWAGLTVLFSRQILSGSQDFFLSLLFKLLFIFLNMKPFLALNISAIGRVDWKLRIIFFVAEISSHFPTIFHEGFLLFLSKLFLLSQQRFKVEINFIKSNCKNLLWKSALLKSQAQFFWQTSFKERIILH